MGWVVKPHCGGSGSSNYIISGGKVVVTGADLNASIETTTFKINNTGLVYAGGNITVDPNTTDGKMYLFNDNGVGNVGYGGTVPTDSIILAT